MICSCGFCRLLELHRSLVASILALWRLYALFKDISNGYIYNLGEQFLASSISSHIATTSLGDDAGIGFPVAWIGSCLIFDLVPYLIFLMSPDSRTVTSDPLLLSGTSGDSRTTSCYLRYSKVNAICSLLRERGGSQIKSKGVMLHDQEAVGILIEGCHEPEDAKARRISSL